MIRRASRPLGWIGVEHYPWSPSSGLDAHPLLGVLVFFLFRADGPTILQQQWIIREWSLFDSHLHCYGGLLAAFSGS
ncbi:hypothetical protein [Halocatena marina]|uniref:Uncharacterized protein n=1 Tax=Halocatena marina TaxID=2934937 RepID=A0ABD5YM60_9EURY|nr:hypothetical protein [Halocatena marina]